MTTVLGGVGHRLKDDMPEQRKFLDQLDLAAVGTAPRCARLFTKTTLTKWKALSLIDNGCLIVSELVTNAVKASGNLNVSPRWSELEELKLITVRLVGLKASVIFEVWDDNPSQPEPKDATVEDEGGRGLFLVESLASWWGSYPHYGGKVVWAELPVYASSSHGLPKRP